MAHLAREGDPGRHGSSAGERDDLSSFRRFGAAPPFVKLNHGRWGAMSHPDIRCPEARRIGGVIIGLLLGVALGFDPCSVVFDFPITGRVVPAQDFTH